MLDGADDAGGAPEETGNDGPADDAGGALEEAGTETGLLTGTEEA